VPQINYRIARSHAWTRRLGVLLVCTLVLMLLACRLETMFSAATPSPARPRLAQRPTFTPRPSATDTPEATPTAVPTDTATQAPPTSVPATPVPIRRPTSRPQSTDTPLPPPTPQPTAVPTATPTVVFQYTPSDQACKAFDSATSDIVRGTIVARNAAAVGQRVRASSGPGGEPISDVDATSNSEGKYTVVIQCNGGTCDGNFWLWIVNSQGQQISDYVEFTFNAGCRRGVLDFTKS
jgi:hypothetical protein